MKMTRTMTNDIAKRLASLRKRRGYTIAKLSELTGLNGANLSLIETGKRQPQINTLQTILEALNAELVIKEKDAN